MNKIILGAWIAFFTGLAASDVGEMSAAKIYEWDLPVAIFFFIAIPAFLGYLAGRDD